MKVELALNAMVPAGERGVFSLRLILHGRPCASPAGRGAASACWPTSARAPARAERRASPSGSSRIDLVLAREVTPRGADLSA